MKTLSFSVKEILPSLLDKKKTQTIRPLKPMNIKSHASRLANRSGYIGIKEAKINIFVSDVARGLVQMKILSVGILHVCLCGFINFLAR